MNFAKNKGMTLIEIMVILIIIIIISTLVLSNLSNFRDAQSLRNTTVDVVSILNKARQNTLSSVNSTNYGVHFDSSKAVLFSGTTYSSSNASNEIVLFNPSIIIPASGGLNIGGGSDVIFERLTGDTLGGTIKLQLVSDSSKQKTITINKTGVINSN